MPAPLAGLLTALRDPKVGVARHMFFTLVHSQGTVRVWDGIGDFVLSANTFNGIGSLASIAGVSQSTELQTHQVECRLQGVSLDALRITDQNIRGDAATLQVLWLDNEGNTYGPKTVFSGAGDNLSIELDEKSCVLIARLRAPIANWARPPASYYTHNDQNRLFAGDNGLQFMQDMQNAAATGWSVNEEASGGRPYWAKIYTDSGLGVSFTCHGFFDDVAGRFIGHDTKGLGAGVNVSTEELLHMNVASKDYTEDSSGAPATCEIALSGHRTMQVGGLDCYIDASGDVRTQAGELIIWDGTTSANKLRVCGEIVSDGSPTADTITFATRITGSTISLPFTNAAADGFAHLTSAASYADGDDWAGLIFCNKYGGISGAVDTATGGIGPVTGVYQTRYTEHGTGNAAAFASGLLKVSGSNCVISDTGVVLTAAGNRLTLDGDADAFLRVWT